MNPTCRYRTLMLAACIFLAHVVAHRKSSEASVPPLGRRTATETLRHSADHEEDVFLRLLDRCNHADTCHVSALLDHACRHWIQASAVDLDDEVVLLHRIPREGHRTPFVPLADRSTKRHLADPPALLLLQVFEADLLTTWRPAARDRPLGAQIQCRRGPWQKGCCLRRSPRRHLPACATSQCCSWPGASGPTAASEFQEYLNLLKAICKVT